MMGDVMVPTPVVRCVTDTAVSLTWRYDGANIRAQMRPQGSARWRDIPPWERITDLEPSTGYEFRLGLPHEDEPYDAARYVWSQPVYATTASS